MEQTTTATSRRPRKKYEGLHQHGPNANWCFRYRAKDGKLRCRSTGTSNKTEAKDVRAAFFAKLKAGMLPTDMAEWKLGEAIVEWHKIRAAIAHHTRQCEKSFLVQVERVLGAGKKLKDITPFDLRRYQAERTREGVGPKAINGELWLLSAILKLARLWLPLAPDYKRLRVPRSVRGLALTTEQETKLFAVSGSNPRWQLAYWCAILAANTGMRGGEIKRLRLGDVDLAGRAVNVRRESTKTDAGERRIPLNTAAQWALARLIERAALAGAKEAEHFLLPANLSHHTHATDPLRGRKGFDPTRPQASFKSAWEAMRAAAGLPELRFHDLRHSLITRLAKQGTPIAVVQALVGHMSPEMTKYYTHLGGEDMRAAVEQVHVGPTIMELEHGTSLGQKVI